MNEWITVWKNNYNRISHESVNEYRLAINNWVNEWMREWTMVEMNCQ